jgi:hypothetical protein
MGARLAATVLLKDPDTHQTVTLAEGSTPEMRLAVLVTNSVAWEGGRVPAAVAKAAAAAAGGPDGGAEGNGDQGGEGDGKGSEGSSDDTPPAGPDDEPDADPDDEPDADPDDEPDDEPAPNAPAKKTAAKRPTRGKAADQGTGGQ